MRGTLDTLAFEAEAVTIVGEHDYAVRAHLIGREGMRAERIEAVLSHPQPLAQCARFLREQLAGVELRSVSSTAAAVRMVAESVRPWAAIGSRAAAELYGCAVLARGDPGRGRQRHPLRLDRAGRHRARRGRRRWKTSLVFSELGEDHPGALVDALSEFSEPRDQPEPDRVAAAAPGPRPLHVLLRPRGSATPTRASPRRSRASSQGGSVRILGSYPVD